MKLDIEETKSKIEKLAKKHHLSLMVLFGSQATEKTHPQSDVDFAFLSEKQTSLSDIAKIEFEFSNELGIKNLELVDLKNAPPLLLKQIAKKSILLYEKETSLFANFRIYSLKRFMEEKKLLDLRELSLNKFLQTI